MFLIGDVHGEWKTYRHIIEKMQLKGGRKGMDCSLVLGDMGIGFEDFSNDSIRDRSFIKDIPLQHKFIVGNHDDRDLANTHPNCLGDFGYHEKSELFYVSGGFSIDYEWREKDITWWENEELSAKQIDEALELYSKVKPKIIVAHECPTEVKYFVITNPLKREIKSRTEKMLQKMIEIHRPDYFIFGHHHQREETNIDGTQYICLGTLSYDGYSQCIFEIPGITWE
jgi:predicted phosphohydrolase